MFLVTIYFPNIIALQNKTVFFLEIGNTLPDANSLLIMWPNYHFLRSFHFHHTSDMLNNICVDFETMKANI